MVVCKVLSEYNYLSAKMRCSVAQCHNCSVKSRQSSQQSAGVSVTYHKFPTDNNLRQLWIEACKINEQIFATTPESRLRICSDHFGEDDFLRNLCDVLPNVPKRRLKPNVVPSLKLPEVQRKNGITERQELANTNNPPKNILATDDENQSVFKNHELQKDLVGLSSHTKNVEGPAPEQTVNQLVHGSVNKICQQNFDSSLFLITTNKTLPPGLMCTSSCLPKNSAGCPEIVLALNKLGEHLLEIPTKPTARNIANSPTPGNDNNMEILRKEKEFLEHKNMILEFNLNKTRQQLQRANERHRSKTSALILTIKRLEEEMQQIKKSKQSFGNISVEMSEVLQTFLSETQIDVVLCRSKKPKWMPNEIVNALKLQSISERAYIFMQKILNYPLPPLTLLDRYTSKGQLSDSSEDSDCHDLYLNTRDLNMEENSDSNLCVEYEIEVSEPQTTSEI